ncbi:polyprenyl synthetase family protein [Streptomyces xanthophaeus]|uniref:polyprenyl synthetase family protein n=1 Tax=Streptomyces xanthophaeus TaxID=67385 RepID=UPI0034183221
MSAPAAAPALDLGAIRAHVDTILAAFLDAKVRSAAEQGLPEDIPAALRGFLLAGGKRLRPVLCVVGWHAADGQGTDASVTRTAAALEMFHAFALIHDDIMDRSASRRGQPTVHRALAAHYQHAGEDRAWLGVSAAILAGDMALAWSDELLHTAGHPHGRLAKLHKVLDAMREEVIYGQHLDLLAALGSVCDADTALKVIRYKTATYTFQRPLHAGAVLAGAGPTLLEGLSRFALPLGEAFQLRDDLLGVYGNPQHTGKPATDDLREGKHTLLLALASQRATPAQREILHQHVGNPHLDQDEAARIRDVLDATGARTTVEDMISARCRQALTALTHMPCPQPALDALRHIAELATERTS